MDETITWIGVALLVLGVFGIFLSYAGMSDRTFQEGLHALSALVMLMGILLIPGGLARGGFPSLKLSHAVAVGLVLSVSAAGLTTAALVGYGPFSLLYAATEEVKESPIITKVKIVPGSWNPEQEENYVPKVVRVVVGVNNTVEWLNAEEIDVAHTVTDDAGAFDSGLFGKNETWRYTFTQEGEFRYHCVPHPWMRGTVIVEKVSPEEVQAILERLGISVEQE